MSAASPSLKKVSIPGKRSILPLAVLALGVFAAIPRSRDTISFHIVDRSMQLPLTNVSVVVVQKWTSLPIDRLGLPGISAWRTNRILCRNGTITLPVSKRERTFTVSFSERNHLGATYFAGTAWSSPRIQYVDSYSRFVDTKGDVIVELKRRLAIDGSAFIGAVIDQ